MKKNKTVEFLCAGALLCAFVYGLALPLFWGNNPASELGTLSLLCETAEKKPLFWLWGVLTSGGIFINTQYMYKRQTWILKQMKNLGSWKPSKVDD